MDFEKFYIRSIIFFHLNIKIIEHEIIICTPTTHISPQLKASQVFLDIRKIYHIFFFVILCFPALYSYLLLAVKLSKEERKLKFCDIPVWWTSYYNSIILELQRLIFVSIKLIKYFKIFSYLIDCINIYARYNTLDVHKLLLLQDNYNPLWLFYLTMKY